MDAVIIGVLISLVAVLVGMFLIPFLKKKGFINKDSIDVTLQVLEIADLITNNVKVEDEKKKEKVATIVDITRIAVLYVENSYGSEKGEFKKEIALNAVLESLKRMNIEVNSETAKIVDLSIESAVALLKNK